MEHEYALLGGVNRALIGRYLSIAAAGISALVVFVLLTAVDLAKEYGLNANLPPSILSLVGAGVIFAVLYWLFDRYIWRWSPLSRLLKVPNLNGNWTCVGQSLGPDGKSVIFDWEGTVTIIQRWDKLRIRLKTKQSGSNSIAAALIYDEADGYRLFYNYKNDPNITEPHLKGHTGFATLTFDNKLRHANGEYFNGIGRFTFGTMTLKRA